MTEEELMELMGFFKDNSLRYLSGNDGACACMEVYVRGLHIDVHCHRSSCNTCTYGGIHLYAASGNKELFPKEVLQKLMSIFKDEVSSWSCEFNEEYAPRT